MIENEKAEKPITAEERKAARRRQNGCLARLMLGLIGLLAFVFIAFIAVREFRDFLPLDPNSPLNAAQQLYLRSYLESRQAELEQPAGNLETAVSFTVAPGESAGIIATNLAQAGALNDTELFLNYLTYYGLDADLAAGDFTLDPTLTVPQLASTLSSTQGPRKVTLRFLEGWRAEQMRDYLAATTPANIDAAQFLDIVQRRQPYDLSAYSFLAVHPDGESLEGYLFPDTYIIPVEADAAFLVDLMLKTFDRRVTPAMRQSIGSNGLSLREAVSLAAIVEREAVVSEERPIIASVFYNRLAQGDLLQADPTIQYALGYQSASDSWWKAPLSLDDLKFDSPYNTYLYLGLPPSPIANPGLSSLEAVAFPANTDFVFFVADCNATPRGKHLFSVTFDDHLANVAQCS